jgi:hypothetical protein
MISGGTPMWSASDGLAVAISVARWLSSCRYDGVQALDVLQEEGETCLRLGKASLSVLRRPWTLGAAH